MRVFVTGATGFIGKAVTADLIGSGVKVVGLARSKASAEALQRMGAEVLEGSVRDLDSLKRGARSADGVIHLAFTFSPFDMSPGRSLGVFFGGSPARILPRMMAAIGATDRAAINALGETLERSGRPLVTTFGTMGVAGSPGDRAERPATEDDAPNSRSPGYIRSANEKAVRNWAARGVRTSIVRLAPSVHGEGDKGLIPQIVAAARKQRAATFVEDGANRWCGVHRSDAATLFRLALEKGEAGRVYHGVGDDGMSFRQIADIIGDRLGLPVRSTTLADAKRRLGWIAPFIAVDNPASSLRTRDELGWQASGQSFADDIALAAAA